MQRVDEEFERIRDGRELTPFESSAVFAVARLVVEMELAGRLVAEEGLIVDDGRGGQAEHPALMVEKRCSAEIRGWVKDRPDLFGVVVAPAQPEKPAGGGLAKFKVV